MIALFFAHTNTPDNDMQTISSQRYLNDEIVAEKIAARDFVVQVSPVVEFEGATFRVVLDGHHSLAAARAAGVAPEFEELSAREHDAVALIDRGLIAEFLEVVHCDGDYYDIDTGMMVW